MTFDDCYLEMMPHKVVYTAPSTVLDRYGKITYANTSSTYTALIQYENQLVRAIDGVEKVSNTQAVIATTAVLHPEGRFALPDSTGKFPVVITIDRLSDETGQHHIEINFGNRLGG